MPELPPTAEVLAALKEAAAPAAGGAALVFAVGLLLAWVASRIVSIDWQKAAPPFAVLALAVGMAAGNHFRGVFPFRITPESDAKWWHWVWPAVGILLAAELIARLPRLNPGLGYVVRLVGFAAGPSYLVAQAWTPDDLWWMPALIGLWAILTEVGETAPGGSLPAAVAVAAGGAAVVLLHQKTHGLADVAVFIACALAAVAVIAFLARADGSSAAAVGAVALAVLLLVSQGIAYKPMPKWVLRLVAFAPFALGAFLLPGFSRVNDLRFAVPIKVGLVSIPVIVAVVWAMRVAPLEFGTEEW